MRVVSVCLSMTVAILVVVVAKPRKRRKAAGPEEPRIKPRINSDGLEEKNWQDSRKIWIEDCIVKKGEFFKNEKTGKWRDLSFGELSDLYGEQISLTDAKYKPNSRYGKGGKILAATTTSTTTTTIFKRDKRGKAKADLLAKMTGKHGVEKTTSHVDTKKAMTIERGTQEYMKQIAQQTLDQVVKRTKLPPDHRFSVKEYCDFTWRIQNPSPLDNKEDFEEDPDKPVQDQWTYMDTEAESWWGEEQEEDSEVNIDEM
mmetsp:Transcript_146043/g.254814  ORF Transcript_146043/g.254814 Transcript_146043/m.254814 type:complete len:257 (-) Transcript_146043:117-887(-)